MAFEIEIVPSALDELKAIKKFYRSRIVNAIDEQLKLQPAVATRHRKPLQVAAASFAFDPPLWELRVGDYRVFYDVDEPGKTVYVRSVRQKPPHAATEQLI